MRPHVPDHALQPSDVPADDAPWPDVVAFAHGFHAYKVAGSVQRIAARTVDAHERWADTGELPEELGELRLCLFHTARATHGSEPDADTSAWARALVAAIRDGLVRAQQAG